MRLDRLSEDLEDQDEFTRECASCDEQIVLQGHIPGADFHEAHYEASRAATSMFFNQPQVVDLTIPFGELMSVYEKTFNEVMRKFGYIEGRNGIWLKQTIKEDLEDKDEFTPTEIEPTQWYMDYPWNHRKVFRYGNHVFMFVDDQSKIGALLQANGEVIRFRSYTAHLDSPAEVWPYWSGASAAVQSMTPIEFTDDIDRRWVDVMGPKGIREDLDDQDEFGSCVFCTAVEHDSSAAGTELDMVDFHRAHTDATEKARTGGDLNPVWHKTWLMIMAQHGYQRGWHANWHWVKEPIVKEDLDDKDEFRRDCSWEQCQFRTHDDVEEFHAAHMAASLAAERGVNEEDFRDRFHAEMNRRGYFYRPGSMANVEDWIKAVKEDLDDQDEFGHAKIVKMYVKSDKRHLNTIYVYEDGAICFKQVDKSKLTRPAVFAFRDIEGNAKRLLHAADFDERYMFPLARLTNMPYERFGPEQEKLWQDMLNAIR